MKRKAVLILILTLFFSIVALTQELSIPTANTNIERKVEMDIINQAALIHSQVLWGQVSKGAAIPLSDLKGNILAYEIPFSTRHKKFPSYGEIIQSVRRGRQLAEEGNIWGNKELYNQARRLQWGVDAYRAIIISARDNMYPILEYSTGLPRFYTTGDLAKAKAVQLLGTTEVKLTRMYYAGHLDRWFEFTAADGRKILIDVYTLDANRPEKILVNQPKRLLELEGLKFIKSNNTIAWQKVKSGIRIIDNVKGAARIDGVPYYDWSFGCSPTSSAMILGYYDARGYQKLVDYYFDRWDPVEEEQDYDVPNVQRELANAMKTDLSTGGTSVYDIAPGNTHVTNNINGYRFESTTSSWGRWANNFNWNLIKREIDAGRPFHWVVLDYYSRAYGDYVDHSVTAVGYSGQYVIVHNTWDTREHNWYYYTDVGGLLSWSYVIPIVPKGNHPPFLNSIGSKSIREGSELSFTISGRDPDNDPITFSAQNIPAGATFNRTTRAFSWTPSYTQSGTYTVRFKVSDNEFTDYEDVVITVIDVKRVIPKP